MKTLLVAPNLTNSVAPWRRLPLLESEADALGFEGLGQFIIYVPAKNGGILEVGCDDPAAKVVVRYPRPDSPPLKDLAGSDIPAGPKFVYPVRPGEFKWFYAFVGKVTGSYSVWATFKEVGIAREQDGNDDSDPLVPWNFWYYPNAASRKEETAWGSSTLQPCQKYERAFGRSAVFQWEKDHHNDPSGTAGAWFGHCHDAAPAAIIFKLPPAAGLKQNGEDFLCEELKFFATEFFGLFGKYISDYWGLKGTGPMLRSGFYQENKPADDPARFGTLIGDFHNYLVEQLLKKNRAMMMDLRDASGGDHEEVWNQAIYKYEAHIWESLPHADWQDVQIATYLYANDDILPTDRSSSGSPAKIVAAGPRPGGKPKDVEDDPATSSRDEIIRYHLRYDKDGKIEVKNAGNEWLGVTKVGDATELHAPRFAFVPDKPRSTVAPDGDGNVRLDRADILTMLTLRDKFL